MCIALDVVQQREIFSKSITIDIHDILDTV